nr:sigma factor-like helix-turn-helix DNA-binding protein [Spirosoma rigui]
MNQPTLAQPETSPFGRSVAIDQPAFAALYDQYASSLLGVIMAIVRDKAQAETVLEETFVRIRSQFGQFRPGHQPLFIWLMSIARTTALEAKQNPRSTETPILRLTSAGQVVTTPLHSPAGSPRSEPASVPANALIDAVLFKNCTPEEAAQNLGLPVETARQQLRQAMQQLRTVKSE